MKKVLVTGGTRGLGLAICKKLAVEGYTVVAVGRKSEKELLKLCESKPQSVRFEKFDFSNVDKIHDFATELYKQYGAFYGLVNNAAIGLDGILATQHERDIESLLRVNLLAPIVLTKYIARHMLVERSGRIINVSSIIANTGFNGLSVYGASKAGLIGFTKSLSRELGKAGVTVNAIAPGYMETKMSSALQGDKLASIIRRSPLGQLASVSDVAAMVAFLLSEDAKLITGTTVTVDAGSTA